LGVFTLSVSLLLLLPLLFKFIPKFVLIVEDVDEADDGGGGGMMAEEFMVVDGGGVVLSAVCPSMAKHSAVDPLLAPVNKFVVQLLFPIVPPFRVLNKIVPCW
jgi:hypothetical protein